MHKQGCRIKDIEVEVNSLSASKLKLYLKERGLPVSGGKAALEARVLGAGEAQGNENPGGSELILTLLEGGPI